MNISQEIIRRGGGKDIDVLQDASRSLANYPLSSRGTRPVVKTGRESIEAFGSLLENVKFKQRLRKLQQNMKVTGYA